MRKTTFWTMLLPALVLATLLAWPNTSHAQRWGIGFGRGGDGFYYGGSPYYYSSSPWYSSNYGWGGWYPRAYTGYYYPSYYGYSYPTYSSYPSYYDYGVGYGTAPSTSYQGPAPYYTSYESAFNQAASTSAALISVLVPPDAEVWFEGSPTQQRGSDRMFTSPPLEAGRNYTYDIRARWTENGRTVDFTRHLQVRPGDRLRVDFLNEPRNPGNAPKTINPSSTSAPAPEQSNTSYPPEPSNPALPGNPPPAGKQPPASPAAPKPAPNQPPSSPQ